MSELIKLFKKYRTVGLVGGISSGKSSLVLSELLKIKHKHNCEVYVLGVEKSLEPYLIEQGIHFLHSKEDLLDLKIKNSVIFVDEFADLFNTTSRGKEFEKIKKFFNRLAHLNDYIVLGTAQQNFWNKFMCGLIRAFMVKSIEFDSLVNGTQLKRKVMGLEKTSEYRLEIPIKDFYVLDDDNPVARESFKYNPNLDSKKDNIDLFAKTKKREIKENKKEK